MIKLKRSERIKDVSGYEGLYAVTTLGRVWSYRKNKFMSPWTDSYGYSRVTFRKDGFEKDMRLHRLVGEAFIINHDQKPQINHLSGIKCDNRVSNLEWCTARENSQHSSDMGLNKTFKTSYEDKILICQIFKNFSITKTKLAIRFGVSVTAICYIVSQYSHLINNI